jgi:hypothetical protein
VSAPQLGAEQATVTRQVPRKAKPTSPKTAAVAKTAQPAFRGKPATHRNLALKPQPQAMTSIADDDWSEF